LYAERLSALGHACTGIDFSPASINYAREQSAVTGSRVAYHLADIRQADFGAGYNLIMFIFGELNVFRPADARQILAKAYAALEAGGQILLEVSTFEGVEKVGRQPPTWYTRQSGLFSDRPHLCLTESFWDVETAVATQRYFTLDGALGSLTHFAASTQAYQDNQYAALLLGAGFDSVAVHPSLTGRPEDAGEFQVIIGAKR
jgi:SAM-dependent methyltransferase